MPVFLMKDNVIYDELQDILAPLGTEKKGDPRVAQDVFGFYEKNAESVGEEVTLVYRCRQVLAEKEVGSGFAIKAGDRLYFIVADNKVSPVATGTPGTDSYFCGWAKHDAAALDATVLMNFDGTRYDETL